MFRDDRKILADSETLSIKLRAIGDIENHLLVSKMFRYYLFTFFVGG